MSITSVAFVFSGKLISNCMKMHKSHPGNERRVLSKYAKRACALVFFFCSHFRLTTRKDFQ